ncbi:hypothetical protein [Paraburkholderia guartelaensis]|nr:hypothetical protein [Paraburkholderia guartelaensis]
MVRDAVLAIGNAGSIRASAASIDVMSATLRRIAAFHTASAASARPSARI